MWFPYVKELNIPDNTQMPKCAKLMPSIYGIDMCTVYIIICLKIYLFRIMLY